MKTLSLQSMLILACTCVFNHAVASDVDATRLQQSLEEKVLCEDSEVKKEEYKQIAENAGLKTVIFRYEKDENGELSNYEGFFIRENKSIKVFGFELMAIYFEPDNSHFQILLNATKEDVFNIIKSKGSDIYPYPIEIKYNIFNPFIWHSGRHTTDGGGNSNRTLYAASMRAVPVSIEVESCAETWSKWFGEVCRMFKQKPLTWMGCAITYEERQKEWTKRLKWWPFTPGAYSSTPPSDPEESARITKRLNEMHAEWRKQFYEEQRNKQKE